MQTSSVVADRQAGLGAAVRTGARPCVSSRVCATSSVVADIARAGGPLLCMESLLLFHMKLYLPILVLLIL